METNQRTALEFLNPMQVLIDLNLKTLESMSFINPLDVSRSSRPEALIEKNVEIMVNNGHKLLDYMHELFLIGESQLVHASRSLKTNSNKLFDKTQLISKQAIDESLKTSKKMSNAIHGSAKPKRKTSVSTKTQTESRAKKVRGH